MKRIVIAILAFATGLCLLISCGDYYEAETLDAGTGIAVLREESYFRDYTIQGDRIQFNYVIVLENYTPSNFYIQNYIDASFPRKEIKGWLGYQKYYKGCFEESKEVYLRAGEKKTVVLQFEGEYLGGPVNTGMNPPTKLIMMQSIERK